MTRPYAMTESTALAPKKAFLHVRRLVPRLVPLTLILLAISLLVFRAFPSHLIHRFTAVPETSTTDTVAETLRPPRPERTVRAPFYLKLHKTGSSTIAHHLLKFTRSHKLRTLNAPAHFLVATPNPTPYKYDAIVAHHVVFNYTVIKSYMKQDPDLVLTSIRLPLQRQLSWFQQQNKDIGEVSCESRNETLLAHFDAWYVKRTAPQFAQMTEAGSKETIQGDLDKILDQFDFVFIKERLQESFECFCEKTGIRLCSAEMPLVQKNVRPPSCVKQQLLKYRATELLKGSEMDLLLYEAAGQRVDCRPSQWCHCPVDE